MVVYLHICDLYNGSYASPRELVGINQIHSFVICGIGNITWKFLHIQSKCGDYFAEDYQSHNIIMDVIMLCPSQHGIIFAPLA